MTAGPWLDCRYPGKMFLISKKIKCCGSGSGSERIRNFLPDPDLDPDVEIMDPNPAPEVDMNLKKIQKLAT
jgi:hypothetical protein